MPRKQPKQIALFEGVRLTLEDALELSLASLTEYGSRYRHWALAYSGGKDSSATVAFVTWAVLNKLVPRPDSLTILYADTRMELPPLQRTAMQILEKVQGMGFSAQAVLPALEERFYPYMLGRGVPPPKNRFRWCTPQLKVEPMLHALENLRETTGEKLLMLTGVRMGESAIRDERILLSCNQDTGECGQGWFQTSSHEAIADTLAPLLHWRVCNVYDWIYFDDRHGLDEMTQIAVIYGEEDVRTGCIACNLASDDKALRRLIRRDGWAHLTPLLELRALYKRLTKPQSRKRKAEAEILKDGSIGKNPQRMGPLTMAARAYGLERVLDIQTRARVDLINAEEERLIRELWQQDTWPRKWSAEDVDAVVPLDAIKLENGKIVTQSLLV